MYIIQTILFSLNYFPLHTKKKKKKKKEKVGSQVNALTVRLNEIQVLFKDKFILCKAIFNTTTVLPAKSDSDVMFCLQIYIIRDLESLVYLSYIHKWYIDSLSL